MHARGKVIGPIVVIVIIKIARSRHLGILASDQHHESLTTSEKRQSLASKRMIRAMNATNRTFVQPRLLTTPRYAFTVSQLRMLQLVVGNGSHVINLTSTGSVVLYVPSSALLMAKAVQCVHAHGVCAAELLLLSMWVEDSTKYRIMRRIILFTIHM